MERKRSLDELQLIGPAWVVNGWHPGDIETVFEFADRLGHERVVANKLDSAYLPGKRTRTWLSPWVWSAARYRRMAAARPLICWRRP